MKKRVIVAAITAGLLMVCAGCGDTLEISQEQNDMIAEYVAGAMLKYSYKNEWNYQKLALKKQAESAQKSDAALLNTPTTAAATQNENVSKSPISTTQSKTQATTGSSKTNAVTSGDTLKDLKNALNLGEAEIQYSGVKVGRRYPEGDYVVSMSASPSCKLVAVEFNIINKSGAEITANTMSSGVDMKLNVKGTSVNKLSTIIKNDITNLKNARIATSMPYTVCAVFQVPDTLADELDGSAVEIYGSGKSLLGSVEIKVDTTQETV